MASENAAITQSQDDDENEVEKKEWTELDQVCFRLRQNKITKYGFDFCRLSIHNDAIAVQVAESLTGNTSLEEFELRIRQNVTEAGAKVLGKAIQNSAVQSLSLIVGEGFGDVYDRNCLTGDVFKCIYTQAIKSVQTLKILNQMNDYDAYWFRNTLQHVSNPKLETLYLKLGAVDDYASSLFKAIRKSTISDITLDEVWSEVYSELLSSGIMSMATIRHLTVYNDGREEGRLSDEQETDESDDDERVHNDDDRTESLMQDSSFAKQSNICSRTGWLEEMNPPQRAQVPPFKVSQIETMKVIGFEWDQLEMRRLSTIAIKGNANLRVLNLENNQIGDKGIRYLIDSWKGPMQLETLELLRNRIGLRGLLMLLHALDFHPSLKHLNLSDNPRIGKDRLDGIVVKSDEEQSSQPFHVDSLDLSSCELNDQVMDMLCKGYLHNSSVKVLNLKVNNIGDVGAKCLVDSLDHGLVLECLNLWSHKIGVKGQQRLLQASSHHPCWKELNLFTFHAELGYRELATLAQELTCTRLSKLTIGPCGKQDINLTDTSQAAIKERKSRDAASRALVAAVKANLFLQELPLRDICIPCTAEDEIYTYVESNKFGRRSLLHDEVEPPLWSHILAKCQKNNSCLFLLLQEKPSLIPDLMRLVLKRHHCPNTTTAETKKQQKQKRRTTPSECDSGRIKKKAAS